MTPTQLINIFKSELSQEEQDTLQIRLVTDHGQTPMQLNGQGIGYVESDDYMPDEIAAEDLQYYPEAVKVFMLEAF